MIDFENKEAQLAARALVGTVPLCGCGTYSRNWSIVRSMLQRARELPGNRAAPTFYNDMPEHVLSDVAVEFIAGVLSATHPNLLEHGSSLGYSWLTDAGKVLLAFLEAYPDANTWPEWVTSSEGDEPFTAGDAALAALLKRLGKVYVLVGEES